jgi:hypothetical protein
MKCPGPRLTLPVASLRRLPTGVAVLRQRRQQSSRDSIGQRATSALQPRTSARSSPWMWLHCERCQPYAPLACAVPVIQVGTERIERQAEGMRALYGVRRQGRDYPTPRLGRLAHRLSAVSGRTVFGVVRSGRASDSLGQDANKLRDSLRDFMRHSGKLFRSTCRRPAPHPEIERKGRFTGALMVGAARFELATPSPPDWCANRAALRSADARGL